MPSVHDKTWYEATVDRGAARPQLSGTVEADACVIGGGLAGLTAALELVRRGKKTILLEAQRVAWAASGRNGGFVSNGFAEGLDEITRKVGLEAARHLYRLSCFGTEFVRREIAVTDPTIKMGDGWIGARRFNDADGLKAYRDHLARDFGDERQFCTTEETRAKLATARYYQSLVDTTAFHMHPLRYALMIAAKAEAAGAKIHENSAAANVSRQASGWEVKTGSGRVKAAHVIHTVSSLDRTLHPGTGRAILPVATYVAVTEPLQQESIRTRSAASDQRRAGNYYRLVDDGRILWGGAITTRVSEPGHLAERMKRDMLSVYPRLGNPHIDYAWAGLMGYTRHFMPLIGGDGQGQWWATAFGGHGMNTTAMGGILLARAIAAGDDEYRRFAPYAPVWAGGPFGRIGVQAGYWWMQARDLIDEAKSRRAA